ASDQPNLSFSPHTETLSIYTVGSVDMFGRNGGLPFFFQAEDGIRDRNVTGVQTCAISWLPVTYREPRPRVTPQVNRRSNSRVGRHPQKTQRVEGEGHYRPLLPPRHRPTKESRYPLGRE